MQKQQFNYCNPQSPSSGSSCSPPYSGSFPEAFSGSPPATEQPSDRYKTELCRSFEEGGTCRYGNKCRFAHGRWEMRALDRHPKYKTEFCRTYHSTGFCPYGQRCHFIHGDQGSPRLDGPSAEEPPGVGPTQNGCDERADERSVFGEGIGSEVGGNLVDLHAAGCGQMELFQGLQQQERRLTAIGEAAPEFGLEGKLVCLRRKLELEKRMRLFEIERQVDELKERSYHQGSSSSSSSRLEPKLLELELSAILQRRRSQLRCNSVGSGCETPPLTAPAGALDSRTSSPLSSSADETRSPMMIAGSPPYSSFLLQDLMALPRSPLHHHDVLRNNNPTVSRFAMRAAASSAAVATVSNTSEQQHKDRLPFSLWSRGDGQGGPSSSVSGLDSPHRLNFHSSSSSSSGPYFVFDVETLARLIRR